MKVQVLITGAGRVIEKLREIDAQATTLVEKAIERWALGFQVKLFDLPLELGDDEMTLYSGLLWMVRPDDKLEKRLADAVEYTEAKHGRPVQLIAYPVAETYPAEWRGVPLRADRRILPHHLYLVTGTAGNAPAA